MKKAIVLLASLCIAVCIFVGCDKPKQTQAAPTLELSTVGVDFIEVKEISGAKYTIDNGTTWQDSNMFTRLTDDTEYTVKAKLAETDTHKESPVSAGLTQKTEKFEITLTDKHSKGPSKIYLQVYFKLSHDVLFDAYNYTKTDEAEKKAEYNGAYEKLFTGTDAEKAAAIAFIGNDVIVSTYYVDDATGDEVSVYGPKTKAWGGHFLSYTVSGIPTDTDLTKIYGEDEVTTLGVTISNALSYTTVVSVTEPAKIAELSGKTVTTKLTVILNGNVYTATSDYEV